MVLSDGVPANFRFLVGSEKICKRATGEFDYRIVVDASELARVGRAFEGQPKVDLNIDHHITNDLFGRQNLVISDASATAEVLAKYLPVLGFPISPEAASALLTGIITDTIGFRTTSVTPELLRVSAGLMELGANLPELYYSALTQRSLPATRFWGAGLGHLQSEDGLVWTSLSLADRNSVKYPGRDDADLINVLSAIEGVEIAIIFVQHSVRRVKISWRVCGQSTVSADVSAVAQLFGGGGHRAASGAEVDGSLEGVQAKVLEATQMYLNNLRKEPIALRE
jgi:phosphoesterase RecJ-like protein